MYERGKQPAKGAQHRRFRTTKDIVVPKGSPVVYIGRMKQDVERMVQVIVKAGPHKHFDWLMHFDDALEAGLIEEVE